MRAHSDKETLNPFSAGGHLSWRDYGRNFLRTLAPIPDEEWGCIAGDICLVALARGEAFVYKDGPCQAVGLISAGLVKTSLLTPRGVEFIVSFDERGSFVAACAALLRGEQRSDVTIVALEPTELLVIDFACIHRRLPLHWTWQQIRRVVAERAYVQGVKRQIELQTMTAEERFRSFLSAFPHLASRISQQDVAAYVGVTAESLSRLRATAKRRAKAERKD